MPFIPAMKPSDIAAFLKAHVKPLRGSNGVARFRAAAYLTDGTYLPCVVFESEDRHVDLALGRFQQADGGTDQFRDMVRMFVAGWSSISAVYLSRVERSPFAWPLDLLGRIHGETVMGWTAFVVVMKDGRMFSYDVPSMAEPFYDLPDGYGCSDIRQIHSGMMYSDVHGMEDYRTSGHHNAAVFYHERPCFYCYMKELDEK